MPRVPTTQPTETEPRQPLPTPFQRIDTSGIARAGAAAQRAGLEVARTIQAEAERERDLADNAIFLGRKNQASEKLLEINEMVNSRVGEHALQDPTTGQSVGVDALEQWDGFASEQLEGLSPRVAAATQRYYSSKRAELASSTQQYEIGQRRAVSKERIDGRMSGGQREAVEAARRGDTDAIDRIMLDVTSDAARYFKGEIGLPTEQVEKLIGIWRSQTLRIAALSMVADSPNAANDLFEEYESLMLPEDATRVRAQVAPAKEREASLAIANDFLRTLGERITAEDRTRSFEFLLKITDPDQRTQVSGFIDDGMNRIDRAQKASRDQVFDEEWEVVSQTGSLDQVSANSLDLLSPQQIEALEQRALDVSTPRERVTDWAWVAENFDTLSERETAEFDERMLIPHVSRTDFKIMRNEIQSARTAVEADSTNLEGTINELFDDVADQMTFSSDRDDEKAARARLKRNYRDEIARARRIKGSDLTRAEINEVLDRLAIEVSIKRRFAVDKDTYVGLLDDQTLERHVGPGQDVEIPADERQAVIEWLASENESTAESNINRTWVRWKAGRLPGGHEALEIRRRQLREARQAIEADRRRDAEAARARALAERQTAIDQPVLIEDIPMTEADKNVVITAMDAVGIPVTPDNVREAWIEMRLKQALPPGVATRPEGVVLSRFPRPLAQRREIIYRTLRSLGLSDRESRQRSGLDVPPDTTLLDAVTDEGEGGP